MQSSYHSWCFSRAVGVTSDWHSLSNDTEGKSSLLVETLCERDPLHTSRELPSRLIITQFEFRESFHQGFLYVSFNSSKDSQIEKHWL